LIAVVAAVAVGACASADSVADDSATQPDELRSKDLPACLGQSQPISLFQNLPFADVTVAGATGPFLVDFATTGSAIDVLAFPTPLTAARCPLGASCSFDGFTFFGGWGTVTLVSEELDYPGAALHQAGILGTDFLAANVFTLDYERRQIRRSNGGACDDAALTRAGLRALSTKGFYGLGSAERKPMSDVLATAGSGPVPNVPTVPVRVAGVTAIAQLDTGFADVRVPHSVNINAAFFDAIRAKSPDSILRDAASDLSLTTCAGVAESVEAWRMAPGTSFELVDESGRAARAEPAAVLFVKRTPAAALRCGGIGTWTAPAAQVATSFYVDAGVLVFDPFAERVWITAR
jgi:hypothetical protein